MENTPSIRGAESLCSTTRGVQKIDSHFKCDLGFADLKSIHKDPTGRQTVSVFMFMYSVILKHLKCLNAELRIFEAAH